MIRRLPFTGALNFRDIGGYPAAEGGQTRWGAIYRSDSLHNMTAADLRTFDQLGIKTIYDLRRVRECEESPGPREHVHLEIPNRDAHSGEITKLKTHRDGEEWLLGDYLAMLASGAAPMGDLLTKLADPGRRPAVIHCFSGKDRTGLVIALLLTALGVRREDVLDDYELTNDCRVAAHVPDVVEMFVESGIAKEAAEGLLSAPRWAMAKALDELDETCGGIDSYLLGPCGLRTATLDALRAALIS
jgi:protein-tyrosine phosphatase